MRRFGSVRVIGVLEPQKIALGKTEEPAQTQIGVPANVAGAIDNGMDTVAGHADRMRKLVLAYPDLVQERLLENLTRMRIAKPSHSSTSFDFVPVQSWRERPPHRGCSEECLAPNRNSPGYG